MLEIKLCSRDPRKTHPTLCSKGQRSDPPCVLPASSPLTWENVSDVILTSCSVLHNSTCTQPLPVYKSLVTHQSDVSV